MIRNFLLLGFILSLPALAALGHDIYLAYNNTDLQGAERFWLTDLGWLWINYAPDSYDWAVNNMDKVVWNDFVDPVLQQSAFYVALVPLVILMIVVALMKIFGLGAFQGHGLSTLLTMKKKSSDKKIKKGDFGFSGHKDKGRVKYKRK